MLYAIRADGKDYPLRVVSNQTWGGAMQTVIYESPGTNGGVVIVTGRTSNTITLTGKLLADRNSRFPLLNLNEKKNIFLRLKDKGKPVVLIAPLNNNDTGIYTITEFNGNVVEGLSTYLPFTMVLTEYRQANLKRTVENLISLEPGEEMRTRLQERDIQI